MQPVAKSRGDANAIKQSQPVTVVIGIRRTRKAEGHVGWIEEWTNGREALLGRWKPPAARGVGAHAKHLKNLYIYFRRWATWKVFGSGLMDSTGLPEQGEEASSAS